jgi:hypothetical protein
MIRFLEHDASGNIWHVLAAPEMTIVPLVNMVTLRNADGTEIQLEPPVGISEADFDTLMGEGSQNYLYQNGSIVRKG